MKGRPRLQGDRGIHPPIDFDPSPLNKSMLPSLNKNMLPFPKTRVT